MRRGYRAIHGDRALAYQGDPETGAVLTGRGHAHHIWDVKKVRAMVADQSAAMTFFCGGSRNFRKFVELFDLVFVLEIDRDTLETRLSARPDDEFGGNPAERALIRRLHEKQEDVSRVAVRIDARKPLDQVVDEIVAFSAGRRQDSVR